MRRSPPYGYTIIELMGVLLIMSILIIVALPLYQKFALRAQVSEGLALAGPVKQAVVEHYLQTARWPQNNSELYLEEEALYRTDYVDNIRVVGSDMGSSIVITYRLPALGTGNTLILDARLSSANQIVWGCRGGNMADAYRPRNCRREID